MQFRELIGQEALKEKLVSLVSENRLGHALLFLGAAGTGGLPMARALAQYLVCEKTRSPKSAAAEPSLFGSEEPAMEAKFPADSCGECPACIKARDLIHPDIHFTFPVVNKKGSSGGKGPKSTDYIREFREHMLKYPHSNEFEWLQYIGAENRQGNIFSSETEDILHNMNLKSFETGYKIAIIWKPEALKNEGNKLLKIIEEPPPNSLFILVAEQDQQILPTILSRTQLIKIPALSSAEIATALTEKENVPAERAEQVAALSGGSYFAAQQLLQHTDDDMEAVLRDWLNVIIKNKLSAQVEWIDKMAKKGREKQKQFLQYIVQMLHHAVRMETLGEAYAGREGTESNNKLAIALNRFDLSQKAEMAKMLETAAYHIERNANAKILFHSLTIRLYYIIKNKSLILND